MKAKTPEQTIETTTNNIEILSLALNGSSISIDINIIPVLVIASILLIIPLIVMLRRSNFNASEITITEPFSKSKIKVKANIEDKKIAHKIWTELVTRKAALPFERDKDVIIQVYDSWHKLFQCVRDQISALPVEKLRGRKKTDIEQLIDISTQVLNEGLRPHLTEWQAKYRAWYESAKDKEENKDIEPQELQKKYEHYNALVSDIEIVNTKLASFADELKKIVRA